MCCPEKAQHTVRAGGFIDREVAAEHAAIDAELLEHKIIPRPQLGGDFL